MAVKPAIYTLPAPLSFLDSLAAGLLAETKDHPEQLSDYRLFLPTRRACRDLRDAFLQQSNGKPLLLPTMHPLGDVDEDEITFHAQELHDDEGIFSIPPAISALKRQVLLARLILQRADFNGDIAQAMSLAQALGRFMDQIIIEGLSLSHLADIVPGEFADHWNITLDFLKIISEFWPKILDENGVIDAADRRNRLIHHLIQIWAQKPPNGPVIAAGSTGTVPATAALLKTIAMLSNGAVILPGLDCALDDKSRGAITVTHPQHSLNNFLNQINMRPSDVQNWPALTHIQTAKASSRSILLREMMRPAETVDQWQLTDKETITQNLSGLNRFDCKTEEHEALVIALALRRALETPNKTAALVTPDRTLGKRVANILKRWHITIDDSAGRPLSETPTGRFILNTLNVITKGVQPIALLSVLKDDFCFAGLPLNEKLSQTRTLDKNFLRGQAPYTDFDGLIHHVKTICADKKKPVPEHVIQFIQTLSKHYDPLVTLKEKTDPVAFEMLLKTHLELVETLSERPETQDNNPQASLIWSGDEGERAANFFAEILDIASFFPPLSIQHYADLLLSLMRGISVRPTYGTHPRLMILGQMEARLGRSDLMILSGLNEGMWPPDTGFDPWMSRPMRGQYGLPDMDMRIGLSAHDFSMCFEAQNVILTRSERAAGAPTVPSRWLSRMDTVMKAANLSPDSLHDLDLLALAEELQKPPDELKPALRPAPKPPVDYRPVELPVTAIETLMRDPYAVYAKYVLGLRKLDPHEDNMDAALRGNLLHAVFENFIKTYKETIPDNACELLMQDIQNRLESYSSVPDFWRYWQPRFVRIVDWFVTHEKQWRKTALPLAAESKGSLYLKDLNFTLTAKADRIDKLKNDNSAAIIDYKTGTIPGATAMKNGLSPQLPLEALILTHKGFSDIEGVVGIGYMAHWKLSGGNVAGDIKTVSLKNESYDDFIVQTEAGFRNLIKTFQDPQTAYTSLPRPANAPRLEFQDYAHLARVQEWAALDDSDEMEAA